MKLYSSAVVVCLLCTIAGAFTQKPLQGSNFKSFAKPTVIAKSEAALAATPSGTVITAPGKATWRSPKGEKNELPREIMAGLVVALATIPTSISYSTVIGVNPITGIWNSAFVGLVMTIIGGAPGSLFVLSCATFSIENRVLRC